MSRYGYTFLLLSGLFGLSAAQIWDASHWLSLAVGYASLSFAVLAAAYAGLGTWIFFKSKSSKLTIGSWPGLAPYLLMNACVFRIYRDTCREPAFVEVAPNLFFGRRLTSDEARNRTVAGWKNILDLAVEFSEVPGFRSLPGYRSLPVLDGTAPTQEQLQDAVAWIAKRILDGPVYVHCALGHGRSACLVLAYFLSTGIVDSASVGLARLQRLRPGVRLNRVQMAAASQFEQRCK